MTSLDDVLAEWRANPDGPPRFLTHDVAARLDAEQPGWRDGLEQVRILPSRVEILEGMLDRARRKEAPGVTRQIAEDAARSACPDCGGAGVHLTTCDCCEASTCDTCGGSGR